MKQRITYLLPEGTRVDPASIQVSNDTLTFTRANEAAEEWRLTLGWDELPTELQELLKDSHELRLKWASSKTTPYSSPLVARLPAGFHAFFTPRTGDLDVPVCPLIKQILDFPSAKCHSVAKSWTKPRILSERFASMPTFQYYYPSSIPPRIGQTFLEQVCRDSNGGLGDCHALFEELVEADWVDVDFDAIGRVVVFTAYWGSGGGEMSEVVARRRVRPVRLLQKDSVIEVGVLSPETAKELEQISLGGYLTVIGESDHPGITLFSFPSRHHPLPPSSPPTTYKATFLTPTGLHPKLQITLPRHSLTPPATTCSLHAYWTLPSALFIDRFQFSDPLFLSSNNLAKLHTLAGEQDLEAPDWVVEGWGSTALLELATPPPSTPNDTGTSKVDDKNEDWTITIPTHARYLASIPPEFRGAWRSNDVYIPVPWPTVFWACEAQDGLKMATNPFDRVNLGYDGLFGPKTMFYHIPPAPGEERTVAGVSVPVLDPGSPVVGWVGVGTLVVVVAGMGWVFWCLVVGVMGRKRGEIKAKKKQ